MRVDLKPVIWWLLFTLFSAALVMHFAVLELFNLPTNPIQLPIRDRIIGYVNPYFFQNWNFFSPHPVDRSEGLIASDLRAENVVG